MAAVFLASAEGAREVRCSGWQRPPDCDASFDWLPDSFNDPTAVTDAGIGEFPRAASLSWEFGFGTESFGGVGDAPFGSVAFDAGDAVSPCAAGGGCVGSWAERVENVGGGSGFMAGDAVLDFGVEVLTDLTVLIDLRCVGLHQLDPLGLGLLSCV